jgi:hypothetical protein
MHYNLADVAFSYRPIEGIFDSGFLDGAAKAHSAFFVRDGFMKCRDLVASGLKLGAGNEIFPHTCRKLLPKMSTYEVVQATRSQSDKLIIFVALNRHQTSVMRIEQELKRFESKLSKYSDVSVFIQFDHFAANFNVFEAVKNVLDLLRQRFPKIEVLSLREFTDWYYSPMKQDLLDLTHDYSYYWSFIHDELMKQSVHVLNYRQALDWDISLSDSHGIILKE